MSKLMIKGTPAELKKQPEVSPPGTRRVSVAGDNPPLSLRALKELPFVLDATLVESEIHLLVDESKLRGQDVEAAIREKMQQRNLPVAGVRPIEPSLEDVFVTLTRSLEKG